MPVEVVADRVQAYPSRLDHADGSRCNCRAGKEISSGREIPTRRPRRAIDPQLVLSTRASAGMNSTIVPKPIALNTAPNSMVNSELVAGTGRGLRLPSAGPNSILWRTGTILLMA